MKGSLINTRDAIIKFSAAPIDGLVYLLGLLLTYVVGYASVTSFTFLGIMFISPLLVSVFSMLLFALLFCIVFGTLFRLVRFLCYRSAISEVTRTLQESDAK
jgi:hypothetical protein